MALLGSTLRRHTNSFVTGTTFLRRNQLLSDRSVSRFAHFASGATILMVALLGLTFTQHSLAQDTNGTTLSASFIWTGQATQTDGAFVAFRKTFQLTNVTNPITLRIFADARYMVWLNGQYVQRGPNRFEPEGPEYDSLDLTPFAQTGSNTVVVLVTSRISNGRTMMHVPGLTAHIAQGGQTIVTTDNTWKWSDQTRYRLATTDWANIYDQVDARVESGAWTLPAFNDSAWSSAQTTSNSWGALTASRIPLLRETVLTPTWSNSVTFPVTLTNNQQINFGFPRMVLAYVEITMDADAGSELQLTYSTAMKIICRAGVQTYITSDTHSIYTGGLKVVSGRVTLQSVKFVERLYPFDRIGSFTSSDTLLNKLWTTCVRGLEVTSEDAYVDCTDRERVEWMDCDPPAFDVTRVAMAGTSTNGQPLYADPRLLEVMLRRTAYTLQPDGWVKAHTCSDRFDIHAKMEDRACDWVQGARRYYESTGKTNVLSEIWPAIVTQMNYFLNLRTARGLVLAREWVVWGNPLGYQTIEGTALNAFVQKALVDAAYIGNVIGQTAQASTFQQAANDLATAINSVLWNSAAGTYYGGYDVNTLLSPTRHAALFALDQGIVPENRRASVTAYLKANAPTENDIMQYYYYFKQQYGWDTATDDTAVLDKLRAEWADMAYSPYEAGFEGLHSWGSQAHVYGIFPAYFLSAYTLGVRLEGPVWTNRILIEPRLGDLQSASGVVATEHGPVPVAWSKSPNGALLTFSFTVPTNKTATVRLPKTSSTNTLILNGVTLVNNGVLSGGITVTSRWFNLNLTNGTYAGTLTLSVLPPTILTQPSGGVAFPGNTFSFSVDASPEPLTYQWQKNLANILNATNATLTLTNLTLASSGDYRVLVSNGGGTTNSTSTTLQVVTALTNTIYRDNFTGSSGNLNNRLPDTATIASNRWVAASAWRTDGTRATITNATVCAFLPFTPSAGRIYRLSANIECLGTGTADWLAMGYANGTTTGSGWHVANNAVGWQLARDSGITTQDGQTFTGPGTTGGQNTGIYPTTMMNYAVELDTRNNDASLWTFTFLVNSNIVRGPIAFGGTGPTISSIGLGMLGQGGWGYVRNFTLTSIGSGAPSITQQPTGGTFVAGSSAALTVAASGTAPLSYQWQKNQTNIVGATNATLSLPALALTDAGDYRAVVTNVAGNATSDTATITVLPSILVVSNIFNSGNVSPSIACLNNDLIQTSLASVSPAASGNNFTGLNMRNGSTGAANANTTANPGNIMDAGTYDFVLNTNSAPDGYDITSIVTYSGWTDFRAGQDHSLWYQTVANSSFVQITNISFAATAGSLRVAVNQSSGAIASGVRTIRVVVNQSTFVYRELDVTGTATVVPVPTLQIALLGNTAVRVWWDAASTGFTLKSTTNLATGTSWQTVNTAPILTNGVFQVTLPTTSSLFLRLAK